MYHTIFKLNYIFILALVAEICSFELYNFDNFGKEISKRINENLAPPNNLGSRISANVEKELAPLRNDRFFNQNMNFGSHLSVNPDLSYLNNLGQQIQESVYQGLEPVRAMESAFKMKDGVGGTPTAIHLPEAPLHNLGSRISAKVDKELAPLSNDRFFNQNTNFGSHLPVNPDLSYLNNLGQQIQENVYQELEPVRAMEIVFKMKLGVGGTTIATHLPEGKKFLIRNHQIFECSGSITEDNGECSGTLKPFQISSKSDYCYSKNSYSIYNNYICIGAGSVTVINNDIICKSNSETPALLITLNEYNKLCNGISEKVEYKYITNLSDPAHVEIPNKNKHVKCTNSEPGVCIFSESLVLPSSFSSSSTVYINTYSNTL